MGRKSNYEKDIFMQLNELMSKVDKLESNSNQDRKTIKTLNSEVSSLRKENSNLRDEVVSLKQENISLNEKCNALTKENGLLRNDNERMKRILNNDSSNSSTPPSQDNPGKPANSYNGRKSTDKKKGAQLGHKGYGLSKADVEDKIKKGVFQYRMKEVGTFVPGRAYVTRYKLDLEVQTVATEYRIYADENGKFHIPNELKGDVFYGENIKAIAAFLYSEGVVANDRARNEQKEKYETCFSKIQLERYSNRYDQILSDGIQANKKTKGRLAKKEEKALLNRLMKYKKNHLLFLYNFRVHYSNNMSEKDLRICKNRQKMAGGFRTASGRQMYCRIISFIETVKQRSKNIFQSIKELMAGQPVIQ